MASAAERLASSIDLSAIGKASDLKKRLLFVIGALVVYRIGTYVPLPGIDPRILNDIFSQQSGGILGMFNMFSGGALQRMSILALNVMPYISASIIVQILTVVVPSMAALKKEGESGRRRIIQYTRYGTVALASMQGYMMAVGLESMTGSMGSAVIDPGLYFRLSTMVSLVAGTMFLMWLGEQITSRGIGNGISLIIFAGIVAGLPAALDSMFELGRTGVLDAGIILLILIIAVGLLALIVFVERAQRRIVVQYPKRQVGNRLMMGDTTHMPLKVNTAGVIPPIFASAILLLPATVTGFSGAGQGPEWFQTLGVYLAHGHPVFITLYAAIIIFFSFFYTAVVFNSEETSDNLRKAGGFIPGIRPGKNTADYLDYVLTRLTVLGSLYLAVVCVAPEILIAEYAVPFYLGGTSLLIVVNVTIDFVTQIQSHLFAHQYEGLIRKAKLKGRRR